MKEELIIPKFTIVVTTRCNLKCKLCCEYVPDNAPFPDITVEECKRILDAFFSVADSVTTLHLSGGGEPFLHANLGELIEECMVYRERFERLMLFTNSTILPSELLLQMVRKYREKIVIQVSHYGINPEKEQKVLSILQDTGATIKYQKYYGDEQTHGGWVNFGAWACYNRTEEELKTVYTQCAVTKAMHGNWRTRDGKVHWCSRSQRGTELGLIPNFKEDYVDLFDGSAVEEQRNKFRRIMEMPYINACNYCSGDAGTEEKAKRFQAAEQKGKE